jgi:SAM-dependent methyltransferase
MHITAKLNCEAFANNYGIENMSVLDVGSMDVNGSLRPIFEERNCIYTGLDIGEGKNVDVSMELGQPFPFDDNSFDVVVSSSCLEHDPAFWVTVREMMRVSRRFIYLNVPSAQNYHAYPVDCWRFLADSMTALADLSPDWILRESYIDNQPPWKDCVGVFECTC